MYNWEGDATEVGPRILPRAGEECGEIGYGPLYSPLRAGLFTPDQEIACLRVGSPSFGKYFLVPLPTLHGRADQQGKGRRLQVNYNYVQQLFTTMFHCSAFSSLVLTWKSSLPLELPRAHQLARHTSYQSPQSLQPY